MLIRFRLITLYEKDTRPRKGKCKSVVGPINVGLKRAYLNSKGNIICTQQVPWAMSEIFLYSKICRMKHSPKVLLPKKNVSFE